MNRDSLRKVAKNIHYSSGTAIYGERIIAQARKVGKIILLSGSSKHRIQQTTLKKDAFCMIDKEFIVKDRQLRLKT